MVAAAIKHMASNFAKLDKFEGMDFKIWQEKMHFLLCSMSVDSLEAKYMAEDTSSKKFLVSDFTNYKMTDSRLVIEQYNELLGILDFKHTLEHQKEELTLIELVSHLCIEESLRVQDNDKPKGYNVAGLSVVNMLKHNNSFRYNDNKGKRKHQDTKSNPNKKSKLTCWKYGKPGHLKKDCRGGKVVNKANERKTEVMELIHNDLCDLHATFSLRNKKYIVIFIDDASRTVVRLFDPKLKTLGERGIECIFVGYDEHSKAFRFYVIEPDDLVLINSIIESRDAIFNENRFSLVSRLSLRIPNETDDIGGSAVPKEVTEVEQGIRKEAINDEMDSIMGNNTWVLADLSPCCKPLGCKLIFNRKLKLDGTIEKFKARLVIQMDVKTAFLNGELDEKVYMNQPQGFMMSAVKTSKFDETGKRVIICLYIDDMLIFGTDQVQVDLTKEFLSLRFSMKDMGEADVILVSTHMDTSEKLMPNNGQAVSKLEYSRVIGYLMYAMTCIRSDIAFVVGKMSMYTSNPVLEGYTNASYISNTEDNSSTNGWVFLLGRATGKETKWLRNLIHDILLWSKPIAPISIFYDSPATLVKAYSQMYNRKSRHLGVRHSMIRELITNGMVSIEFVRSQQNLADHLMKGLA
ncbi:zinc finger, CCHC-type containing protein [Tanacetum coccineum]|uniref:Zinc finger, CCHC-type containing protein n=1 Tax=Tanacetum coccineum TaxID=301880 RepID=A0ABQ5IEE7_9ASTR